MFKVDIFVVGNDDLIKMELSRKQRIRVADSPPAEMNVATAEDMVLQKPLWYQAGGSISDRQWGDVLGILRTQGRRLDRAYLNHWAAKKALGELLSLAIEGAGELTKE